MIVIDCAPTGDTVRMLAVPEVLSFYFSRIFPIQRTVVRTVRPVAQRMTDMPIPSDDVFGAVKRVYEQMEGMGPLLQDPKRSSIRIVLNPERMVINESQRLYTYLSLFGFPVDAVIANRVLPEEARSKYFDRWFEIQAGHLATARAGLRPAALLRGAALRPRDGRAPRCSTSSAGSVFGEHRPRGRAAQATSRSRSRRKAAPTRSTSGCPSPRRTASRCSRKGDELVVQVDNQRRHLVLPRTLAGRAGRPSAAFADQRLRVAFGDKEAS